MTSAKCIDFFIPPPLVTVTLHNLSIHLSAAVKTPFTADVLCGWSRRSELSEFLWLAVCLQPSPLMLCNFSATEDDVATGYRWKVMN